MMYLVDVLRERFPLRWWMLFICIHRVTVTCQHAPSYSDIRYIKRSPDSPLGMYNSKQMEDYAADPGHPVEYFYDDSDQRHQNLNFESDYYQRSFELNNGNYNSKNSLLEPENYQGSQFKNPSNLKQDELKKPKNVIFLKGPLRIGNRLKNFRYEPYRSIQSRNPLFQSIGNRGSSGEIINQLIGTGRNKMDSQSKQLKSAYLTKFTSYNITQLKDNKKNESFLFEKRDNSSSDIRYLDSKNVSTNYTDAHSSSLKTILQPEVLGKKSNTVSDNNNEKYNVPDTYHNLNFSERGQKPVYYITEDEAATPQERLQHLAADFVGGQYVLGRNIQPSLDPLMPQTENKEPNEFVGGQYIEATQNNVPDKSDKAGLQHDFVEGQFVGIEGNKFAVVPTVVSENKLPADFVGGQYIQPSNKETLSSKNSNFEENVNDFVEGQFLQERKNNNQVSSGTNDIDYTHHQKGVYDFVGGQFILKQINTESTEYNIQTTTVLPAVTSNLESDTFSLTSMNNDNINELKDEPDVNNAHADEYNTTNKDINVLIQEERPKDNVYNKESTPYLEQMFTSPVSENEDLTITNQRKQEAVDVPNVLLDKTQSKPGKQDYSIIEDNSEDSKTLLSVPEETKVDILNEDPFYKDMGMKSNQKNNYVTFDKNKKITLPFSISRVPYKGMAAPKFQNRPITVFSQGNRFYMPRLTGKINPNGNNVVFKSRNNDDTEFIVPVHVLNSSEDKSQELTNSKLNSTVTSVSNIDGEHDSVLKENLQDESSKPKIPDDQTKIEEPNSDYHEYEDDGVLGISNLNENQSILEKDAMLSHYVTESVQNYFKTHASTEPSNIKDLLSLQFDNRGGVGSPSQSESDITVDNVQGDSSDLSPNQFISQQVPLSLPNTDENVLYSTPQNLSDITQISEDVELYAGHPLSFILNGKANPQLVTNSKKDSQNDGKPKGHLADLCIPLTNEKYISLLDLLSGPFYFDRNGNKVAIALRGDQKKNCTLSSKQCKLFVDLKNISSSFNADNKGLIEEDEHFSQNKHNKRHIAKDITTNSENSYPKILFSNNHKSEAVMQSNEDKSNKQMFNDFIKTIFQSQSNSSPDRDSPTNYFENEPQRSSELRYGSDIYPTRFDLHNILNPSSNAKLNGLMKYDSGSGKDDQFGLVDNPKQKINDPHKNRPTRMIGRSNEGEKCGCSDNQILKSPSPFPNYKQFVAKRYDILNNIVHTVGDWAAES